MNLCDEATIRALLERHGFHFSKSMGQNFLIDPQIPYDIAAASQADIACGVLEIGPGIGPLTSELAKRAGRVVSVELDRSLLPILAETLAEYPNVEIVPGDVMKLDLNVLIAERFQGLHPIVCANLPYNITTPVLTKFIETPAIESVTVLIQKEVAQRLAAPQGSADGGAFSLFLQYYMDVSYLFDVPREKFLPSPKVTSAVLRCVRRFGIYTSGAKFRCPASKASYAPDRAGVLCNCSQQARTSESFAKVAEPLLRVGITALCASVARLQRTIRSHSAQSVFHHAQVAAKNRFHFFRACGRKTCEILFARCFNYSKRRLRSIS